MRKFRTCLVIPSLQAGGMERVMSELAGDFVSRPGTEVHLVLYGITREIFYQVPSGVKIHKPEFRFNNRYRLFYTLRTMAYLRKTIRGISPDSVLSFGEYWNSFVLLSLVGLGLKVFVSDRSQPDKSLGKFQDLLRKWIYPRAEGIIFQTEKAREIFQKRSEHPNTIVIGNPVRTIGTSDSPRQNKVLMVGRLIKSKNQDRLISIFARLDRPDWKLVLVGYDHMKQNHMSRLEKLADELGIKDQVVFTGKTDDTETFYRECSIFAFTSSSEGFPNVIGEAMSAGMPVIAYDCVAGPSEMIKDGENGFLIPLFDDKQFVEKLQILMDDPLLRSRMGKNAMESIREFSKEKICESFFNFISGNKSPF